MEIEAIGYFLTVAECLNFSEAADRNHISQSSFSKAIMRLEKDVGVRLIDRSKHPIRLTPAGRSFYEDCSRLKPAYLEAIKKLETFTEKRKVRILICPKSYAFRSALQDYAQSDTRDAVEYEQTSVFSSVVETMLSGKYDFCITPRPMVIPPNLKATVLYHDTPYLLVNSESPIAAQDSVSFNELNGLTFYESPFSWHLLQQLMHYFDFQPGAIYPDEEGTNSHLVQREEVIHRVTMGSAVSIYCGRDVSVFNDNRIKFLPIRELPELPVVLLERAGSHDSPEKARFRHWVKASLESYVCAEIR